MDGTDNPKQKKPTRVRTSRLCSVCEKVLPIGSLLIFAGCGPAHPRCKKWYGSLLTSNKAAETLGISATKFRSLAKQRHLEPKGSYSNPYFLSGPPCPLWDPKDVRRIQRSQWFARAKSTYEKQQIAAGKAVATKAQKMQDYLNALEITVPSISLDDLTIQASEHYNDLQVGRGTLQDGRGTFDIERASPQSDPEFLERIMVNYLRHELSSYEEELEHVFGKVGQSEALDEIRDKVYRAISTAYPSLVGECIQQQCKREEEAFLREMRGSVGR